MTSFVFPEPGSVPGLPGTFAGCRVDLHEDGTYEVLPLAFHLAYEPDVAASPTPESSPETEVEEQPVSPSEEMENGSDTDRF